jgi:hypothetical protein
MDAMRAHVADGVEIALNLYSERVDAWDRAEVLRADTYAQQVATTVGLCLQVAHLATAHADLQGAVRELQAINRLVVGALVADEGTAGELLERVRDVAARRSPGAEDDVRRIILDLSAGRPPGGTGQPEIGGDQGGGDASAHA